MDIGLSEDQSLFRETTGRFLDAECPLTTVRALGHDDAGYPAGYWRSGAELGWTSLLVGEGDGGGSISGRGLCDLAIVAEEMGRLCSPGPLLPVNVVAQTVSASGTPAQKSAYLGSLIDGSLVATWAFNEHGMRWDPSRISTTARRDGDGWIIDGRKVAVEAASQSALLLVTATCEGRPIQFLVPTNSAGVSITPTASLDLVRRFGDVDLSGVKVGPDAVIGDVDDVER
jgi:alkylation response protein AidB-like acyl-CoA dehydrogenase